MAATLGTQSEQIRRARERYVPRGISTSPLVVARALALLEEALGDAGA